MIALRMAALTLKRLIRSHYVIPVVILAAAVVVLYWRQAQAPTTNPALLRQSGSMSLFVITNLFCYLGTIWLAVAVIPEELAAGHLRMNLTKPARSGSILFGHYLGALAYLAVGAMILAAALTAAMAFKGGRPGVLILGYVLHLLPLYGCLLALGNALVLLINRPIAAFLLLFLAQEDFLHDWALRMAASAKPMILKLPMQVVANVGYALAPPIGRLKLKLTEFENLDFPVGAYLLVLLYCASYVILAHLAAVWLLRRKDV